MMAQAKERMQSNGTANKAVAGSTPTTPQRPTGLEGLKSLFMPSRVDRSATGDGQTTKKKSGFSKLLFAMLIFIIGAQVAEIGLAFVNQKFSLHLDTTRMASPSTPFLGSLTWFSFLYVVLILALYVALYRFKIFPRDPFGAKAAAEARATKQQQTTSYSNVPRTRAARRHATTTAAAKDTPSARRVAAAARTKTVPTPADGEHDDTYERVKAAQRTRRRRESKR